VSDIVRATILAGERDLDGIFNVGTGVRHSFNTVVEMLNEEMEKDVEAKYVSNPIPESVYVYDTCADSSKLQNAVGWEPRVDFEEGIKEVCEQY